MPAKAENICAFDLKLLKALLNFKLNRNYLVEASAEQKRKLCKNYNKEEGVIDIGHEYLLKIWPKGGEISHNLSLNSLDQLCNILKSDYRWHFFVDDVLKFRPDEIPEDISYPDLRAHQRKMIDEKIEEIFNRYKKFEEFEKEVIDKIQVETPDLSKQSQTEGQNPATQNKPNADQVEDRKDNNPISENDKGPGTELIGQKPNIYRNIRRTITWIVGIIIGIGGITISLNTCNNANFQMGCKNSNVMNIDSSKNKEEINIQGGNYIKNIFENSINSFTRIYHEYIIGSKNESKGFYPEAFRNKNVSELKSKQLLVSLVEENKNIINDSSSVLDTDIIESVNIFNQLPPDSIIKVNDIIEDEVMKTWELWQTEGRKIGYWVKKIDGTKYFMGGCEDSVYLIRLHNPDLQNSDSIISKASIYFSKNEFWLNIENSGVKKSVMKLINDLRNFQKRGYFSDFKLYLQGTTDSIPEEIDEGWLMPTNIDYYNNIEVFQKDNSMHYVLNKATQNIYLYIDDYSFNRDSDDPYYLNKHLPNLRSKFLKELLIFCGDSIRFISLANKIHILDGKVVSKVEDRWITNIYNEEVRKEKRKVNLFVCIQ